MKRFSLKVKYNKKKSQITVNHLFSILLRILPLMTDTTQQSEITTITKRQQFEEVILTINAKYQRWFGDRTHPFTGETDNINNYFRFFNNATGTPQLHLKDGLPLEIGKDCRLAFDAIFKVV